MEKITTILSSLLQPKEIQKSSVAAVKDFKAVYLFKSAYLYHFQLNIFNVR